MAVTCLVCGQEFRALTHVHLEKHGLTPTEYTERYGGCFYPEEVREKIRSTLTGSPPRGMYRPCLPGCTCGKHNNPKYGKSEDTKRKNRLAHVGIARPKISEVRQREIEEGRFWPHKWHKVSSRKGGVFKCRSTFETGFVHVLDEDPNVVEFLYECVKIPYLWQGRQHVTTPDFLVRYVSGEVALIEVKALWMVEHWQRERIKLVVMCNFATRYGLTFKWWDGSTYREDKLSNLEEVINGRCRLLQPQGAILVE